MKKICATCGKSFQSASNRATYCSDECRKIGATEKQKLLMRKKRKEEKEQKLEELKKSQADKIGRRLNHVKENDLAHGEFGKWLEKIEINQRVANQFMKVASKIPNSSTYSNLGYNVLYLIATLPEEEILSYFYKKAYNANSKSV